jgi:Asp-tRNA(Asn)/Glu-tRNA(Gln) amidotransferase A subunit family amidase
MAPFACGATGANDAFERCVNPLRASAVVGGSSSGSAVAVAGGLAYASLGTDTAGSVRIPAATCGILGLKATHGLISCEGVHPLARSLDSVGILARCADDMEQILAAVIGEISPRSTGARTGLAAGGERADAQTSGPTRFKIWMPPKDVHEEVARALSSLVHALDATPFESSWDDHADLSELAEIVLRAEAAQTHRAALLDRSALPAVQAIALAGLVMPDDWLWGALEDRPRRTHDFVRQHLMDHDVFVAPALAAPIPDWSQVIPGQPAFESKQLLALHRYMGFVNYLGLPSLVVPIASDRRGLPISVQLIGRPFSERRLLAAARAIESSGFVFDRSSTAPFED